MLIDNAVATLLAFGLMFRRKRAADILDKINARGIERRLFAEMMQS